MRIVKESFVYIGSSFISKFIPFLFIPFLTKILSTSEYGIVSLFVAFVSIYSLCLGSNINGLIKVVYHKSEKNNFSSYIGNFLYVFLVLIVCTVVVLFFFDSYIANFINIDVIYLYLSLVTAVFSVLISIALSIAQTTRNIRNFVTLQLLLPIIEALFIILLVFYLTSGLDGRINSIILSTIIVGLIVVYYMYKKNFLTKNLDFNIIKRVAKYIIFLMPHSLAITAIFALDKMIISSNASLSVVGELAVALQLAYPIWILVEAINTAFTPWIYEQMKYNKLDMVVGTSYILMFGIILITLIYSYLLTFLFDIFIDDKFINSLPAALTLLWIGTLKMLYYLVIKPIVYLEKIHYISIISVISGLIYIALIFFNSTAPLETISLYLLLFYLLLFVGGFIVSVYLYRMKWSNISSIIKVILYLKLRIYNNGK
jgi:O-antigen/teichoic acid export membrane protein